MNPGNSATSLDLYHAEVLKFYTRILWYFNGDYSINNPNVQNLGNNINGSKGNKGGKGSVESNKLLGTPLQTRMDYFDWISLEHEYWNGEFINDIDHAGWTDLSYTSIVDDFYQNHLDILSEVQNIIAQNNGCYVNLETYENLRDNTVPVYYNGISKSLSYSMDVQAEDIKPLPDRIFVTHYYRCVTTVLERYCLAIEAWGKTSPNNGVELWPLFSAERADYNNSYCGSPGSNWGEFWGKWMDASFVGIKPGPCPASPGFPYEVDESEDLYLNDLSNGATAGDLVDPGCACCLPNSDGFQIGNYNPVGFMWFMLHFMPTQNIQKSIASGITVESSNSISNNVFPNPTKKTVSIPSDFKLTRLMTLNGQIIELNSNMEFSSNIDFTNLANGIYIMELKSLENNSIEYVKVTKN
jgi:hypothetical protein